MKTSVHTGKGIGTQGIAAAVLSLAALFCTAGPATATVATSTTLEVRAVVLAWAKATVVRQPDSIVVTDRDIRNGYVDAVAPSLIEVGTNSRQGCLLTIQGNEEVFSGMEVNVMGRNISVNPQGGMIPLNIFGRQVVPLSVRFSLNRDSRPGRYAWPLMVSASPM